MSLCYLIGPVTAAFADQYLEKPRRHGDCLTFHSTEAADLTVSDRDGWEDILAKLPPGWLPDLLVLYLPYTAIPPKLWQTPIPILGLAPDWNLLWHCYRGTLAGCDCVFTDLPGTPLFTNWATITFKPPTFSG